MELEIFDITEQANWSNQKKTFWQHLQLLTQRIVESKKDVTSNFGTDYFVIRNTYGMFGDMALTDFLSICQLASDYDQEKCTHQFNDSVQKTKYKTLRKLCDILTFHGIDTSFTDEKTPSNITAKDFLEEGVDEELYDEFGFYEKNNQYYTMEKAGDKWIAKPFTNFKLKVLFHMNNGVKPRRVIELTNTKKRKKVVDIETDKLTGKGDFKKFCEGLGNFRFFGSESKLDMLKAYLYDKEAECTEINVLGWHEEGFWAWSNGVFTNKYHALDNEGFVQIQEKHFYIPSGNKQQPNRTKRFSNEIRFKHFADASPTFEEWCPKYVEVFGNNGIVIQLFAMSCLFSDIVFQTKMFFPLLFMYGEGGSGKGSAIKFAQRLFGNPQDPLTLSGKANTDKAKIAVTAQFINTMLLLEEYSNNHDTDQLLKNLWDRYGYKRRTLDSGYGTESVPINSGVAITGNFSPTDDPLLQRIIYLAHNENVFTQQQKDLFNKLDEYSQAGLTSITHELLRYRNFIEKDYRETHQATVKELTKKFGSAQVTARMIENISVLITIYKILHENGLQFSYKLSHLESLLINITNKQNEKRDSGGEVQKFLDVLLHLVNNGIVVENKEYKIEGNQFYMYFKQIHGYYLQNHRSLFGTPGLSSANLSDKIKIHPCFSDKKDNLRIGASNTSGYVLHYDKMGIDIIGAAKNYEANIARMRKMNLGNSDNSPTQQQNNEPPINDGLDGRIPF